MAASPLSRACKWVEHHLDAFTVRAKDTATQIAELKAIGELTHTADVLLRSSSAESRETGRAWLDRMLETIEGGELIRRIIAADPRYLLAVSMYAPFHLAGHRNPALIATLVEELPRAQMSAFAWQMLIPTLVMLDLEPDPVQREQAWQRGVLANRPADLPSLEADAVYLMAHECFYSTSWGHRPAEYGHLVVSYVADMLPRLVTVYAARRHTDLLSELILATHTQRLSCVPRSAWQVLEDAQSPDGNVVPPEDPGAKYPRLSHSILPRTYHTTLCSIMAWASCAHAAD